MFGPCTKIVRSPSGSTAVVTRFCGPGALRGLHVDALGLHDLARTPRRRVVAQRRVEARPRGAQGRQHAGRHAAPADGLLEGLGEMHDPAAQHGLGGARVDPPLHVPDHSDARHAAHLGGRGPVRLALLIQRL